MAGELKFSKAGGDQVAVILDEDTLNIRNAIQMAKAIYSRVYSGENEQSRRDKIGEIVNWLRNRSLEGGETAKLLAADWQEYYKLWEKEIEIRKVDYELIRIFGNYEPSDDQAEEVVVLDIDSERISNAPQVAVAIYLLAYADEDIFHRRAKVNEITDWLEDKDLKGGETAVLLAAEWNKYDIDPEEDFLR